MVARSEDQLFQQALVAHRAGRLGDAVNLYRGALAADPRNAAANHNLGLIDSAARQSRRSRDAVSGRRSRSPRRWPNTPPRCPMHCAPSAAPTTRAPQPPRAIALQPNFVDAHLSLALALVDLDKIAGGRAGLRPALRPRSEARRWPHQPGTLRLRQGRLGDAEQLLVNAVRLRPNYAPAYLRLGDLFRRAGKGVGAVEAYRRARTLDAANTESA